MIKQRLCVVRENQGGRSSVAFSYRIIARPYASAEARLAPIRVLHFGPPPRIPSPRIPVFEQHPTLKIAPQ